MKTRNEKTWLGEILNSTCPDLSKRYDKIRKYMDQHLSPLRSLPEATGHRNQDAEEVQRYLCRLIPYDMQEPLSVFETFCLLAASGLYDHGVLLAMCDVKYSTEIAVDYYNQTREYIINNRKSLGLDVHEARIIGEICRACAMPNLDYLNGIEFSINPHGIVRVPLLSAFLRLADLLHRLYSRPAHISKDSSDVDLQEPQSLDISACISDIQIQASPSWDIRLVTFPKNELDEELLYELQNEAQKELDILYPALRAFSIFFKKVELILNRPDIDKSTRTIKNPFLLLKHFTSRNATLFAGRDKEIQQVTQKILGRNLVILIGESGVGKTSLVEAGIIPKLKVYNFRVMRFSFQDDPIESLMESLRKLTPRQRKITTPIDILQDYFEPSKKNQRLLLIGDHLEQMFTIRKSSQAKSRFIQNISRILGSQYPITFLFCIREDYLPDLYGLSLDLPDLYARDNTFRLHRLSKENGIAALQKASEHASVKISDTLIKTMAEDLCYAGDGMIYPPFLQIVGYRLYLGHYRQCRKIVGQNPIQQDLYAELGTAEQIVNQYLDSLLDQYSHEDKPMVGQILNTMVTEYYTKKRITLEELQQVFPQCHNLEKLLSSLVQQRIVRRSLGEYELIHDFIARRVIEYVQKRRFLSLPVRMAIEFMEDNYSTTGLTSKDIAKAAHVSHIHLASLFRRQLNKSTNRQLNVIRVSKAKEMLRTRDRLSFIAKKCGFSCLSTFSRKFKQIEDMSPLEYRRVFMDESDDRRNKGMYENNDTLKSNH